MITLFYLANFLLGSSADALQATVRMDNPEHHFYQVEIQFPKGERVLREIKMAVWTPGSYKVRDFARNVEGFKAFDLNNNPLTWIKTDKSTWVINVPPDVAFKVSYQVFANEFTVRTSYLDSFSGFINPASVFFYEPDNSTLPYEVEVFPAQGWAADSSLSKRGARIFTAADWDELVDSPIIFGNFARHGFEVRGIPHHWLISGDVNMNVPEMINAMKKIGETVGDLFGGYPFANYYIFSSFRLDGGGGGLEHRNSTMVLGHSNRFREKKGWDRFLGLIIHEYFHAWNVKAIRDKALGPFDYQTENYTDLLWLHEGWTSYYDTLLMTRAGFWDQDLLRKEIAKMVDAYNKRPGVRQQSLHGASFNAWIHQYQRSQTSRNSHISYYSGGALSGLALDLLIRHKTKNEASLDDVMRKLFQDYALQGRSIDWGILVEVTTAVIGEDAGPFFQTYIREANPFNWEILLSYAGLEMRYTDDDEKKKDGEDKKEGEDKVENKPYDPNPKVTMDIEVSFQGRSVIVDQVLRNGAGWKAGLDYDDEILAINDRRVYQENFEKILGWSRPGDEVQVLLSRGDKIMTLAVKLEEKPKNLALVRDKNANELEAQIYTALFNPGEKD